MPTLSVILPAYNAEAYLGPAIQSVLKQSFQDYELIVIDDGSKDRTAELLATIDDYRLRIIRHERNSGLIAGLNEGIEAAKGTYIARMDADDICEPSRFHRQIEYLEAHPRVGVLGTAISVINEQGLPGPTFIMPLTPTDVEWAMPLLCPIAHPSVMMRTNLVRQAGGYSSDAVYAEDYDLWLRLSPLTQMANLPDPLLRLRKHPASVTSVLRQSHLDAAMAVSKAAVDQRLQDDVPAPVIRCIHSWGQTDTRYAMQAVHVLLRLLAQQRSKYPAASMEAASRDAAMRIAYFARHAALRDIAELIGDAHNTYPLVVPALIQKALRRLVPRAVRNVIG